MVVTACVIAVAVLSGLLAFSTSAAHPLDLDATDGLARHPRVRRFVAERFDRESQRGLLLTASFVVVVLVAAAIGSLLDMVRTHEGLAEADARVAAWGVDHATSASVDVMRAITWLGASAFLAVVLAVVGIVVWRGQRRAEPLVLLAVVAIGQYVLVNALKVIVDRPRPAIHHLVAVRGPSFPSAHSTAAAACWAAIALVLAHGRSRHTQALLTAGAVVVATAVAASRALLGVHWLTDVVAGLALGWGWFVLVAVVFRTRVSASPARRRPAGSSP
jgi:undecaprenyl-diphosphatase